MNAQQLSNQWGQIVARARQDEGFKARLLAQPAAVLKEYSLEVPAGIQFRVVENTDAIVHLTLPAKRREGALSDEELAGAAGGAWTPVELAQIIFASGTGTFNPERQGRLSANLPPSQRT